MMISSTTAPIAPTTVPARQRTAPAKKQQQPAKKKVAPAKTTPAKANPGKATKSATPCTCGCGGKTAGGRFLPGHDARLKGELQRHFRNGGLNAKQSALVKELNWERFMIAKGEQGKGAGAIASAATRAGVTVPQLHILKALSKAPNGLTRPQIADKCGTSLSLTMHLGPVFKEDVEGAEKKYGVRSLLGLKMASSRIDDDNGKDVTVYTLAAAGRKALEKAKG
jgi:hypothetical protein